MVYETTCIKLLFYFPVAFTKILNHLALYVDPDWTYLQFLQAASQRLEIVPPANRLFNADGKQAICYFVDYFRAVNIMN